MSINTQPFIEFWFCQLAWNMCSFAILRSTHHVLSLSLSLHWVSTAGKALDNLNWNIDDSKIKKTISIESDEKDDDRQGNSRVQGRAVLGTRCWQKSQMWGTSSCMRRHNCCYLDEWLCMYPKSSVLGKSHFWSHMQTAPPPPPKKKNWKYHLQNHFRSLPCIKTWFSCSAANKIYFITYSNSAKIDNFGWFCMVHFAFPNPL